MPRHPADIAAFGDSRHELEDQREDILKELDEIFARDGGDAEFLESYDTGTLLNILMAFDED